MRSVAAKRSGAGFAGLCAKPGVENEKDCDEAEGLAVECADDKDWQQQPIAACENQPNPEAEKSQSGHVVRQRVGQTIDSDQVEVGHVDRQKGSP